MTRNETIVRSWSYAREVAAAISNRNGDRIDILRRLLFDLVAPFSPSIAVDRDGIFYHVSTADKLIGRYTFGTGSFEKDLMERSIGLLERETGNSPLLKGRTFVDVGANIGTTTIPAIKTFHAAKVIAFEPSPANFRLLRCNIIANDVTSDVDAYDVGLSNESGTALFELSRTNSGDHRVRMPGIDSPGELDEGNRPTITVPVITLDEHFQRADIDIDDIGLLWLDTQGHEGHVLAGATMVVDSAVPVACEYWPYGLQRSGGLSLLHDLVTRHYRWVIDVRRSTPSRVDRFPAASLPELQHRYSGHASYTDILLVK